MTMCKNDDRPPDHKSRFFIASKGVSLSAPRKTLKRLLQNIFLMLNLLYHKHNLIIMTVVDVSIF